jgi:drug/metabolite transporter (DMT)-like permease
VTAVATAGQKWYKESGKSMKHNRALIIVCYATIYLVWGSTYFFIRQAVATVSPAWVMAIRWIIGGVLLLGIAVGRGGFRTPPSLRNVLSSMILGILLILVGNGGITIAERRIDSYIAALLASSTPIVVALFDGLLLRKRLTLARILGVVIGFGGVALLLYNGHSVGSSLNAAVLIGLLGMLSWGLATSLGHRFPVGGDNMVSSGIQMLSIGIVSLVIALIMGPSPAVMVSRMSGASLVGVLYLGVVGSLAFSAYTYLVQVEPAERLVSYALVNPIIALLIGLGLAGESATPLLHYGVPLALVGLGFMLYGERIVAWFRAKAVHRP